MKALLVVDYEGPKSLGLRELPFPKPSQGDVVVEVHAAGIAFPDLLLTYGRYQVKPDLPFVLGAEAAGVVKQAPPESALQPGQRVAAYVPKLGALADFVSVPEANILPIPDAISCGQAAAMPINYLTAHFAFRHRGRLKVGDSVLVHGAGGGLGLACVHIARALGARVLAVASTQPKCEAAIRAGAELAIPVESFKDSAREWSQGKGIDIVADPVGGDRVIDSIRCLAADGRLLILGFAGGPIPTIPMNRLLLNNVDAVGVLWGPYATARPGFMLEQWMQILSTFQGKGISVIDPKICTLEDVPGILADMETRKFAGKAVAQLTRCSCL